MRERAAVAARLALGDDRYHALLPVTREALRRAFMPTLNAMAATGLVSLPGMMTGQILAGVEPIDAIKYQLLVMSLIAGGTGLGTLGAVIGGCYRLTDHRHRLRLDRIASDTNSLRQIDEMPKHAWNGDRSCPRRRSHARLRHEQSAASVPRRGA